MPGRGPRHRVKTSATCSEADGPAPGLSGRLDALPGYLAAPAESAGILELTNVVGLGIGRPVVGLWRTCCVHSETGGSPCQTEHMVQMAEVAQIVQRWHHEGQPYCEHPQADAEFYLSSRTDDLACMTCGETWPRKSSRPAPSGYPPLQWEDAVDGATLRALSDHGTFILESDPVNPGQLRLRHEGGVKDWEVTGPLDEQEGKRQAAVWYAAEATGSR